MLGDLLVLAVPFLGAAAFLVWWRRRRAAADASESPSVELILLLREPRILTSEHLVTAAKEAFGIDLSGAGEDATEFVVAQGPMGMIQTAEFSFPLICDPNPLVKDPVKASEGIKELRMRSAFSEHRGYISFACIRFSPERRAEAYARLGKLVAALVDETTLLVYSPEAQSGNLITEETVAALRGGDPLASMRELAFDAIGLVDGEDPRMIAATAEARERLPEFLEAFHATTDHELFLVKAPLTDGAHTEFMWIQVTEASEERLRGILANKPFHVRGYRHGAKVDISLESVSDWAYPGQDGPIGLFTEKIVRDSMSG